MRVKNQNRKIIKIRRGLGVNCRGSGGSKRAGSGAFAGKTFVLTGALDKYTREQAGAEIEKHGGRVSSSISKKTDYVLAGTDPGSKLDKANKIGVKIIGEAEFDKLLAAG